MEADRAEADLGIAADIEEAQAPAPEPQPQQTLKQPKKRFVGRRTAAQAAGQDAGASATAEAGAIQSGWPSPLRLWCAAPHLLNEWQFLSREGRPGY
jgi:2-(3-amino-3-carboxypropyl)histidine synthase